jgi:hypothetical protein
VGEGERLERRAAVAALCEPALLARDTDVRGVLAILDRITADMSRSSDRRSDAFRALRKALAYGWSVAVTAAPTLGRPLMERWMRSDDPDVRWVMRRKLAKKRLLAVGAGQVEAWGAKFAEG